MQFSNEFRSKLAELHERQYMQNNAAASKQSFYTRMTLGGFNIGTDKQPFSSTISSKCFERLLQTHQKHYRWFQKRDILLDGLWTDVERKIVYMESTAESHQETSWGIKLTYVGQTTKELDSVICNTQQSWSKQRQQFCFMLNKDFRFTLSEIVICQTLATTYEASFDLLPRIDTWERQHTEPTAQYLNQVIFPALQSVMQILHDSHIPLDRETGNQVYRLFYTLTGVSITSFSMPQPCLLGQDWFDEIRRDVVVTDKMKNAKPAFLYIHQNAVFLYTMENGLRQIEQEHPLTAKWNETVIVGESNGKIFQAMDVAFANGVSFVDDCNSYWTDRIDTLKLCFGDLQNGYLHSPFEIKPYAYCKDEREIHEAIRHIFDQAQERGPYDIGGIYLREARDSNYFRPLQSWESSPLMCLRFSEIPGVLLANGADETICLVEGLHVCGDLFYPNRSGYFRIEGNSAKLYRLMSEDDKENEPVNEIDDVYETQKNSTRFPNQYFLEHGAELAAKKSQPTSDPVSRRSSSPPSPSTSSESLLAFATISPANSSTCSLLFRPVAKQHNADKLPVLPSYRKRKAPDATLCMLLKPIPKNINKED